MTLAWLIAVLIFAMLLHGIGDYFGYEPLPLFTSESDPRASRKKTRPCSLQDESRRQFAQAVHDFAARLLHRTTLRLYKLRGKKC